MITEDYVSFDTAKLLKEKGFDEACIYVYLHDGSEDIWDTDKEDIACQKPTLQMAMKWLRKEHNLFIGLEYVNILGLGFVYQSTICRFGDDNMTCLWKHSYEEALEAAIKYCLEHLI